jgi:hypothetical protein
VTGQTKSSNFPTAHALQSALHGPSDTFVAKLNALGTALVYSTYLGGSGEENFSYDGAIVADAAGNAYLTGKTGSSDFPTIHSVQSLLHGPSDAFVAKLNATGATLVSSTYLGGSGEDEGRGIAVDGAGSVYLTGFTDSSDFPTVHPLQSTRGGFCSGAGKVPEDDPSWAALVSGSLSSGLPLPAAPPDADGGLGFFGGSPNTRALSRLRLSLASRSAKSSQK